jgi:hypothetical protein
MKRRVCLSGKAFATLALLIETSGSASAVTKAGGGLNVWKALGTNH